MKYVVKADKSNAQEVLEAIEKETASFSSALKAFGYGAEYCFFNNGILKLEVFPDRSRDYQPKIYNTNWHSSKIDFEIQTTSYGSLTTEEYPKFLEACNMAMTAVEFLQNYDYSSFPEVEFEKK